MFRLEGDDRVAMYATANEATVVVVNNSTPQEIQKELPAGGVDRGIIVQYRCTSVPECIFMCLGADALMR